MGRLVRKISNPTPSGRDVVAGAAVLHASDGEAGRPVPLRRARPGVGEPVITFRVPGAAVPCPRPRVNRNGKPYYSERYESFKRDVKVEFLKAFPRRYEVTNAKVSLLFAGARRNADLDNLVKGVLDALTGLLWAKDSVDTIPEIHARWEACPKGSGPYTEITVAAHAAREGEHDISQR